MCKRWGDICCQVANGLKKNTASAEDMQKDGTMHRLQYGVGVSGAGSGSFRDASPAGAPSLSPLGKRVASGM